ncbi:hypothetical protein [Paenibacillus xylanilyticus]|uniref:hypothetical protein n=1 Tax=Paenibacillus xylanilyticus TaxID=248903 RepID=UPI00129E7FC5|nr:hypothetical protein [Paenibacillus xylanilyticus]
MANTNGTLTSYPTCTVNHIIIPEDPYTFPAILATPDTAVLYDPERPGYVEIARVKPTQAPNVYLCNDATIVFQWNETPAEFVDKIRNMSAFEYMAYVFYTSFDVPEVMPSPTAVA